MRTACFNINQAIREGRADAATILSEISRMQADMSKARDIVLADLTEDDVPMVKKAAGTVSAIVLYRRFHPELDLTACKKYVDGLQESQPAQPALTLVLVDSAYGNMHLYVGDAKEPTGHPNLNICDFILSHPDATTIRLERAYQEGQHDTTVGDLRKLTDGWWHW